MKTLATAIMSAKGQIVIPENIREKLGLKFGSQFMVIGEGDVVILKTITPPSMKEFNSITSNIRKQAKSAGLKPSDIEAAVKKVRDR